MSYLLRLLLLFAHIICFMSCENDDQSELQDGKWDPMEITKPNQSISKNGGVAVFEVKNYDSWMVNDITIQIGNQPPELISVKWPSYDRFENDWLSIIIPDDDRNKLYCTVKENRSNDKRTISISVSSGDSFGIITVTQE